MDVAKLRYWHWMLISIVAGVAAVEIRGWSNGEVGAAGVPADLSGQQRRFEKALLGQVEGHALVRNIRVYPRRVAGAEGGLRLIHLVQAQYCTGETEEHNGRQEYVWRDSLFVLPVPYHPQTDPSDLDPKLADELAKRARLGRELTVLDLLDAARIARGTRYSYAWWDAYPWPIFGGGCVVLIGIMFPALLHLVAFRRLTRPMPRRTPAVHLTGETVSPPAPAQALVPEEEEMETDESTEMGVAEFRMKPDDYYPTEHRAGES